MFGVFSLNKKFFFILLSLSFAISAFGNPNVWPVEGGQDPASLKPKKCKDFLETLAKLVDSRPEEPKDLKLPKSYTVKLDTTNVKDMGGIAKDSWNAFYDPQKLEKILKKIASGHRVSSSDAKYLKKLRKRSIMVKSVVQILGKDHRPPHRISHFNSKLGLLNDSHPKRVSYEAADKARLLLDMLENLRWHFEPGTDVKAYFDKRKDKIKSLVKQGILDDDSVHSVRKMLRQLMMITYLNQVIEPTDEGKAQVEYMHSISRALARFRSSHQAQYEMPRELKHQILRTLNHLHASEGEQEVITTANETLDEVKLESIAPVPQENVEAPRPKPVR